MKIKLTMIVTLTSLIFLMGGVVPASAQMTTGKTSSKVVRTGNRAQAGDFGLYLGVTSDMFTNIFDDMSEISALPMINFKYMMTDQAELRLGLELYKTSTTLDGEYVQQVPNPDNPGTNLSYTLPSVDKNSSSNAMLYPGFAWHFSKKNLLDVYVGAELPLGWDSSTEYDETGNVEIDESGSYVSEIRSTRTTKRAFVIGLGAFVGLQAYIANLPLALGAEFGISSRFDTGLKYKSVAQISGSDTQTYYSSAIEDLPGGTDVGRYNSLKARKGEIGGQIRLTLTYYFK